MRLLEAKDSEVTRHISATDCSCALDPSAEFPAGFAGSIAIALLALIGSAFTGVMTAAAIATPLLFLWVGTFAWRAKFTRRNWTVAIAGDRMFVQIFRKLGPREDRSPEPNVLEFLWTEISGLSPGVIDITWSSISHKRITCLFIEPKVDTSAAREIMAALESYRDYSCDVPKVRLALARDGLLLIEWAFRRPVLSEFLKKVSQNAAGFPIGNPRLVSIDFRDFILQSEAEQRNNLLYVKQLGLHASCVSMLKRRMRMSTADANRLMDSL